MHRLTLYTTSGCHLCEHAEAILDEQGHTYQIADIDDDLELMERYGVRIPVVRAMGLCRLIWNLA